MAGAGADNTTGCETYTWADTVHFEDLGRYQVAECDAAYVACRWISVRFARRVMRAKMEKPHIERPTVGGGGLAQIGGMVMGQSDLKDLNDGLRAVAASHDRCTLMREAEMLARKKEVERPASMSADCWKSGDSTSSALPKTSTGSTASSSRPFKGSHGARGICAAR